MSKSKVKDLETVESENIVASKEAWNELNSLIFVGPSQYPYSLLDILDAFFEQCVTVYPERFMIPIKKLGNLARCRKGVFTEPSELCPPPVDVAIAKHLVNRWNPSGKRYLYLARSTDNDKQLDGYTENEFTCLEEMRAVVGEEYTFADFMPLDSPQEKAMLNMDYFDYSLRSIDALYDGLVQEQANKEVEQLLRLLPDSAAFFKRLEDIVASNGTRKLAVGYVGDNILLPICKAIFTPIDNEISTPDQREVAYKSFHTLAGYLENKGVSGVIYPSTRTEIKGIHTQNIVAFYPDDFKVVPDSIRKVTMR